MSKRISIYDTANLDARSTSSSTNIDGYDFATIFASGISGAVSVGVYVSPDDNKYYLTSTSGLVIDVTPQAMALPELAPYIRFEVNPSGVYTVELYVGNYTYSFVR